MKLAAIFGTVALAGKADPRAKSGRTNVSNDRFIYKTPRCLITPELCDPTCHKTINASFGNITITADDYKNNKNCLWTIDIPADRQLSLKFVNDFDIEWHAQCAYDKVIYYSYYMTHNINIYRCISWMVKILNLDDSVVQSRTAPRTAADPGMEQEKINQKNGLENWHSGTRGSNLELIKFRSDSTQTKETPTLEDGHSNGNQKKYQR